MNFLDIQNLKMPNLADCNNKQKSEMLCQVVQFAVSVVTDTPQVLPVQYEVGERTTTYTVDCSPEFMGQLLGKEGKNINAIRTFISSVAARIGIRAVIEVIHVPRRGIHSEQRSSSKS